MFCLDAFSVGYDESMDSLGNDIFIDGAIFWLWNAEKFLERSGCFVLL